jgi:hypothetical protein
MEAFLDEGIPNDEMRKICPELMRRQSRYDGEVDRARIIKGGTYSPDYIRGFHFKPLDCRFSYADTRRPLWSEPSTALAAQTWEGNAFLVARLRKVKEPEGTPFYFVKTAFERDVITGHARAIPLLLAPTAVGKGRKAKGQVSFLDAPPKANLSAAARAYLGGLGVKDPDLSAEALAKADAGAETAGLVWMHALAIGYSPAYLSENADGVRRDWPRVPLPDTRKALEESANLGRQVAALLDTEADVRGVTASPVEPFFRTVGVLARTGGGALDADAGDLVVTAGWGHAGKDGATMPGKGRILERPYDAAELEAIGAAAQARGLSVKQALALLGPDTRDVYLNERAYWRNVPAGAWEYFIGGYQVVKKWLSYREQALLGRPLRTEEADEVTGTVRRLAAIILMQPALDENYRRAAASAYTWPASP